MIRLAGRVLAVIGIAILQAAWLWQSEPLAAKILPLTLLVVAIVRPEHALAILAALTPITTPLARLLHCGAPGAKLLEQLVIAVAAGALIRLMRGVGARTPTRLAGPALFVGVVAVASALAVLPSVGAVMLPGLHMGELARELWQGAYFQRSPFSDPIYFGLLAVEGALIGWIVESAVRRSPALADELLRALLWGCAALSALTVVALVSNALRSGAFAETFPRLFFSMRLNQQTDVNAGASILVLAFLASFATIGRTSSTGLWRALLVAMIGIGLWNAGSRMAFIGVAVALMGRAALSMWRGSARVRWLSAAGLVLVPVMLLTLAILSPEDRNEQFTKAVRTRGLLTRIALRMTKSAPLFGIGVSRFYVNSGAVAGPEMMQVFGPTVTQENAHNNFLQVLAEQGAVGLFALLAVLGTVAIGAWRARASPDRRRRWLVLAFLACVLTWLTGHPLLVTEFAFVFWLYLGVLAGLTPAPAHPSFLAVWALAAVCVFATVPTRAADQFASTDLEHIGAHLSQWQHDDVIRYRRGGSSFGLYVPALGRPVQIMLRREPTAPNPLNVEMRIDDRLVNSITLSGADWQSIDLLVPKDKRHSLLIDFRVTSPPADATKDLIRLGKAIVR